MPSRRREALDYHAQGRPGKIQVTPTKPFKNQRDLVAAVTNGTAVLGLGNIGAPAGEPVMEGKGILFKTFADIEGFDLEVGSEEPEDLIRFCQLLEPTVGGINLEDVRSPDCFYVEERLRETLSIPVFHDDQHGTAIIAGAAPLNAADPHPYLSVRPPAQRGQHADLPEPRLRQHRLQAAGSPGGAQAIGPVLVGMAQPVYVLQRGAEVNVIVNLAVLAAVDALEHHRSARPAHQKERP